MSVRTMNDKSRSSNLALWIGVGAAIYVPQVVLVAQSWETIVALAPMWGVGLLGVAEVVAGVALLAAMAAGITVWRKQGRAA